MEPKYKKPISLTPHTTLEDLKKEVLQGSAGERQQRVAEVVAALTHFFKEVDLDTVSETPTLGQVLDLKRDRPRMMAAVSNITQKYGISDSYDDDIYQHAVMKFLRAQERELPIKHDMAYFLATVNTLCMDMQRNTRRRRENLYPDVDIAPDTITDHRFASSHWFDDPESLISTAETARENRHLFPEMRQRLWEHAKTTKEYLRNARAAYILERYLEGEPTMDIARDVFRNDSPYKTVNVRKNGSSVYNFDDSKEAKTARFLVDQILHREMKHLVEVAADSVHAPHEKIDYAQIKRHKE